jgi:hypothetical protein
MSVKIVLNPALPNRPAPRSRTSREQITGSPCAPTPRSAGQNVDPIGDRLWPGSTSRQGTSAWTGLGGAEAETVQLHLHPLYFFARETYARWRFGAVWGRTPRRGPRGGAGIRSEPVSKPPRGPFNHHQHGDRFVRSPSPDARVDRAFANSSGQTRGGAGTEVVINARENRGWAPGNPKVDRRNGIAGGRRTSLATEPRSSPA